MRHCDTHNNKFKTINPSCTGGNVAVLALHGGFVVLKGKNENYR